MGLLDSLIGIFAAQGTQSLYQRPTWREEPVTLYAVLRSYADNNDLYRALEALIKPHVIGMPGVDTRGLRNPTHAAVEFYPAVLWPGTLPDALPIETPDSMDEDQAARLVDAIQQVWTWSNWNQKKQVFARSLPMLGDQFIKVATRSNSRGRVERVFQHLIQPDFVIDFDVDERGFLTYVRVDVPRTRRTQSEVKTYVHTEIWEKRTLSYRTWENDTFVRDTAGLGQPLRTRDMRSFGIDFLPFVHAKFLDDGSDRGRAVIMPALDKIDEINRMASRLHQMLFRHEKAMLQLTSALVDKDGFPMEPPDITTENTITTMTVNGEPILRIPSGWKLDGVNANLTFTEQITTLTDDLDALAQTDLPELLYYQFRDAPELSGKAILYLMTPAIAKAVEARGNGEQAMIRANQMALTIGAHHDLFDQIGTFEDGDFEHWFATRAIIPLSEIEEAELAETKARTHETRKKYGATNKRLLLDDGYSQEEVDEMLGEPDEEPEPVVQVPIGPPLPTDNELPLEAPATVPPA